MPDLYSTIRLVLSRRWHHLTLQREFKQPNSLEQLFDVRVSRNASYFATDYHFHHFLPQKLVDHRDYFERGARGFGERAFHSMWYVLFEKFKPENALEVGVYRGQTITLWKLLSYHFNIDCAVGGISPFTSAGDAVSHYEKQIDYLQDIITNHQHFDLALPRFCKTMSTDPEAHAFIRREQWDCIYIDGNHDYDVVRRDWEVCSRALGSGGIIVLDDSALNTDYRPPAFATAGHPGPSRLAQEIDPTKFREIFSAGHNRVFQKIP